jgi:hypothetical protein
MSKLSTITLLSDAELDAISGGHGNGHGHGHGHGNDNSQNANNNTSNVTVSGDKNDVAVLTGVNVKGNGSISITF